ncbi:hypothetical protein EDC65_2270 [Stella humosa]|uniref:Uncharacterized protein n=1 Tax=Stella humosa TaxID=94 RepID=A0A3N1M9X5_9PROT|nr:hypothetical protein [Stella humosa]ROQ00471.1 hypothetical protein EDC65_2270 [Stella humosa]BBK30284.1 hypothetical protein STHU_09180 [Stella humosa]
MSSSDHGGILPPHRSPVRCEPQANFAAEIAARRQALLAETGRIIHEGRTPRPVDPLVERLRAIGRGQG